MDGLCGRVRMEPSDQIPRQEGKIEYCNLATAPPKLLRTNRDRLPTLLNRARLSGNSASSDEEDSRRGRSFWNETMGYCI